MMPSGRLVVTRDNAKSIRSMRAMFITPWYAAPGVWGGPAAMTTCRDGCRGRLPAAGVASANVSAYQSSRMARMTPSPQRGTPELRFGGMPDEPADV